MMCASENGKLYILIKVEISGSECVWKVMKPTAY